MLLMRASRGQRVRSAGVLQGAEVGAEAQALDADLQRGAAAMEEVVEKRLQAAGALHGFG